MKANYLLLLGSLDLTWLCPDYICAKQAIKELAAKAHWKRLHTFKRGNPSTFNAQRHIVGEEV